MISLVIAAFASLLAMGSLIGESLQAPRQPGFNYGQKFPQIVCPTIQSPKEAPPMYNINTTFYAKYIAGPGGLPILASSEVSDEALYRTWDVLTRMTGNLDKQVFRMFVEFRAVFVIAAPNALLNQFPGTTNLDAAIGNRGGLSMGGNFSVTIAREQNILTLPFENAAQTDKHFGESIVVHEAAHLIHQIGMLYDPYFEIKLNKTYNNAKSKNLWEKTYARENSKEYFAEAVQSYFDSNRLVAAPDGTKGEVATRDRLQSYDPEIFKLIDSLFNGNPWRYQFRDPSDPICLEGERLPPYSPPIEGISCPKIWPAEIVPAKYQVNRNFYQKYQPAKSGIAIISSAKVEDEAMQRARYVVDQVLDKIDSKIVQNLNNSNVKISIIARTEKPASLPEYSGTSPNDAASERTAFSVQGSTSLITVGEENLLHLNSFELPFGDPAQGACEVLRGVAYAVHQVGLKHNPTFDGELQGTFKNRTAGLWENTRAGKNHREFWAHGVQSYFDCGGFSVVPDGYHNFINTRQKLFQYEPVLHKLVQSIFLGSMGYKYEFRSKPLCSITVLK